MKLIFKDADWSANGINENIIDTVVENLSIANVHNMELAAGNYMIVANPTSQTRVTIYQPGSVGSEVYLISMFAKANEDNIGYFTINSPTTVQLEVYNTNTTVSIYKVVNTSFTTMTFNVTTVQKWNIDVNKTYDLHIKILYSDNNNFTIYDVSGTATILYTDVAVLNAEYTHRISGVSVLGLRSFVQGVQCEYWLEEVQV